MGRTWMFIASAAVMLGVAVLFWMAYPRTTIYARGYSERAFKSIREGMTTNDVLKILGAPIFRHGRHGTLSDLAWEYSIDDRDNFFDVGWQSRTVYISQADGVVTRKYAHFVWYMPWE